MVNVVVTGATKGIGKAVAQQFLSQGANLAICARSQADLEAVKAGFEADHPQADILIKATDMAVVAEVEAFAGMVLANWDRIDVIVNNAGVFIPGEIHNEEAGKLEKMIHTNLYSAYYLTRALLPPMISAKQGHIFNMCSIASIFAYPNGGSYSISKFALLGFSKVLREEMKRYGINVTALLPGATLTDSWSGTDLPASRFMQPEDVAGAVYNAYTMGQHTCVEEILLRPKQGDI